MIERFFFDRVDAESRRPPVSNKPYLVVEALAHVAQAALAFAQAAVARADIALQASVCFAVPVLGADDCFLHACYVASNPQLTSMIKQERAKE